MRKGVNFFLSFLRRDRGRKGRRLGASNAEGLGQFRMWGTAKVAGGPSSRRWKVLWHASTAGALEESRFTLGTGGARGVARYSLAAGVWGGWHGAAQASELWTGGVGERAGAPSRGKSPGAGKPAGWMWPVSFASWTSSWKWPGIQLPAPIRPEECPIY